MKKVYFNKVKDVGVLSMFYVFFGVEHPILFLCVDNTGNKYLCQCYEYRGIQKWHVIRVAEPILEQMINGNLSILEVFKSNEYPIHNITYDMERNEMDRIRSIHEIDVMDLPSEDMYIDADEREEYLDFLGQLTNEKETTNLAYQNSEARVGIPLGGKLLLSLCFHEEKISNITIYEKRSHYKDLSDQVEDKSTYQESFDSITFAA